MNLLGEDEVAKLEKERKRLIQEEKARLTEPLMRANNHIDEIADKIEEFMAILTDSIETFEYKFGEVDDISYLVGNADRHLGSVVYKLLAKKQKNKELIFNINQR